MRAFRPPGGAIGCAGFAVQKEEWGETITSLGWKLTAGDKEVTIEPNPEKLHLACEATKELCLRRKVRPECVETLVGHWSWFALAFRPALSIFDATYKFIVAHRGVDTEVPLWRSVARELMAMVAGRQHCPAVDETSVNDASHWGAGVVETEASIEELKMEARLTAPKGWFAELQREIDDENYFDTMNEEGFESEEGEPILGEGPSLPPLPASLPIAYVAHLFSGRRCADDLEDYITRPG